MRPLVLGNGELLVTFDGAHNMRDLYWPHVGLWNHIGGGWSRFGVWVDGQFAWLGDPGWVLRQGYVPDAPVTDVQARHNGLKISLALHEAVAVDQPVFVRRIDIQNLTGEAREVRLFFGQDFSLAETVIGDTATYDPTSDAMVHYKRAHYMWCSGTTPQGGIHQYAAGIKRWGGAEGTWRDAEDGLLGGNPVAQGSVDSIMSLTLTLQPWDRSSAWYLIACGPNWDATASLGAATRNAPQRVLDAALAAGHNRLAQPPDPPLVDLADNVIQLYRRSLLLLPTQIDRSGAVIAANDSDILRSNADHYSYMWPRDGALVAWSQIETGYGKETAAFFRFCSKVIAPEGYLSHKYSPDGTVGSTWHSRLHHGRSQLPIQEDETALPLFALGRYVAVTGDLDLARELQKSLLTPAADFLLRYRYPNGLPRESYDLWEERLGIFTWTVGTVIGGLDAAATLLAHLGDEQRANQCRDGAATMRRALVRNLADPQTKRLWRGLYVQSDGSLTPDPVVDSSMGGAWLFGALPPDDPYIIATMATIEQRLRVDTPIGGVARYENDYYFQASKDLNRVPGNPWIITALWLASYYLVRASRPADLALVHRWLQWAADQATTTGVLPEQVHPYTGEPLSVAPLTWSHAEFCRLVAQYRSKHAVLAQLAVSRKR